MKFLADECCDGGLVASLRADGYDVTYVCESNPGALDVDILTNAHREERVVITEDKDFGQLVYQLREPCRGILLLRFEPHQQQLKVQRIREVLQREGNRVKDSFVVIGPDKHRRRPLEPLPVTEADW